MNNDEEQNLDIRAFTKSHNESDALMANAGMIGQMLSAGSDAHLQRGMLINDSISKANMIELLKKQINVKDAAIEKLEAREPED